MRQWLVSISLLLAANNLMAQTRTSIVLADNWKTVADDSLTNKWEGFEVATYNDKNWKKVTVPHNWDGYEGYRRMRHGNRHGYAWYRKTFTLKSTRQGKRFFLFFEGVGSYGTVWLNNKKVGYHAGGRTSFTLDITNEVYTDGKVNTLAVRADHPAFIKDLPWVCGGCSEERGFSEGSQPMGIFRPVELLITNDTRIEPFGVHAWADEKLSEKQTALNMATTIKNYGAANKKLKLISKLLDKDGKLIASETASAELASGKDNIVSQKMPVILNPHLWSIENPYLYNLVTELYDAKGQLLDKLITPYGFRWISWPVGKAASSNQFFLNGKPVFINGIAEYEHLIGNSHAFTSEQIKTRAMEVKATGFNAFRDAHQPHNLRYQQYWDSLGILWWTQLSAHVWYDSPEFRQQFKTLLKEWVIERRNSPSVVLWGLQNESKLPADFAKECTDLIRSLDPTSPSQRLVTTCNGGEGTDWDVPQNWTGTYGGNPATYDADVKRQVLIGEYGAWRTIDLHNEGGFVQDNVPYSEDRMTQLMEMKVRLAEAAKDSAAGHFFWLLTSHDNPGRVQGGEGYRELDRIGPVNYKGLMTPWEEPLDVFYMFRANYAPKDKEPMVYIVSHTWPDRWLTPGIKNGITVYSNCDEVELFNDVNNQSLGKKKRGGVGTHFQWDNANIQYNVLYAVGYVNGKAVSKDYIVLHHLPEAPGFIELTTTNNADILQPVKGFNYVYRVNCGGGEYTDANKNIWQADKPWKDNKSWGVLSWANNFSGMPKAFASQRQTYDPIAGTLDWPLFQSFRYGRDELKYRFPLADGEYRVELYFNEPWLGTGGGMNCEGWRLFDVAANGKTIVHNLDIWKEAGHDKALKKVVTVVVKGGQLELSFPAVASGQAVISAIAIASVKNVKAAPAATGVLQANGKAGSINSWLNTGSKVFSDMPLLFSALPSPLYGAEWINATQSTLATTAFNVTEAADIYLAWDTTVTAADWLKSYDDTKTFLQINSTPVINCKVYRKRLEAGAAIALSTAGANATKGLYLIAAQAATNIEPAYDLKAVTTYKASAAKLIGSGIQKEIINSKENVAFKRAAGDTLEWQMAVGVADTYSLTVRYANVKPQSLKATLQLLSADGTLMRTEAVELLTSKPGKWNYLNSSSGSMINAGNYIVRLISVDAEGLGVTALDVQ